MWAPRALDGATLVVGDEATPDGRAGRRLVVGDVTTVADGSARPAASADEIDYGFRLDDDPTVLPDPRSRRQPDGRRRA